MKGSILLNYSENVKQVEDEEKTRFLRNLLEQMGVPLEDFWETDGALSIDQRIKLRSILATYNILVIDDQDGGLKVYVEKELVGEWFKSTYKLKTDLQQLERKKQLYMEMLVNYWTIFEEQER